MSDPEPDAIFGERLVHVVSEELRPYVVIASGPSLMSLAVGTIGSEPACR
jgi:hypothetical protein